MSINLLIINSLFPSICYLSDRLFLTERGLETAGNRNRLIINNLPPPEIMHIKREISEYFGLSLSKEHNILCFSEGLYLRTIPGFLLIHVIYTQTQYIRNHNRIHIQNTAA